MKNKLFLLFSAGVLLLSAQERFDLKVRGYFFAGFSGDEQALDKGMQLSEEAIAADPKNAEALVWHGAGLFFQSGKFFRQGDSEKGLALWKRGIEEMDDAVGIAPDRVGVRIPRGAALLGGAKFVPPDMARPLVLKAVSDYEKTLEIQAATLDQLGTHPKGELLIGLADAYARLGDAGKAQMFYERLAAELPGTPYARKAAQYKETKVPQSGCLGCHSAK